VALGTQVRAGHPAQRIVEVSREQRIDLIVIGHSGHSGVWGRFLGSTAEKVSRHATCSVLLVR
jgi:nucleotide-binding universal stress UspA family protein